MYNAIVGSCAQQSSAPPPAYPGAGGFIFHDSTGTAGTGGTPNIVHNSMRINVQDPSAPNQTAGDMITGVALNGSVIIDDFVHIAANKYPNNGGPRGMIALDMGQFQPAGGGGIILNWSGFWQLSLGCDVLVNNNVGFTHPGTGINATQFLGYTLTPVIDTHNLASNGMTVNGNICNVNSFTQPTAAPDWGCEVLPLSQLPLGVVFDMQTIGTHLTNIGVNAIGPGELVFEVRLAVDYGAGFTTTQYLGTQSTPAHITNIFSGGSPQPVPTESFYIGIMM